MNKDAIIVGIILVGLTSISMGLFAYSLADASTVDEPPIDRDETVTPTEEQERAFKQTNEFRTLFIQEHGDEYNATLRPRADGEVVRLDYDSTAGNSVKSEMQNIAILYAQSANGSEDMPALVIHTNGVTMTVPGGTATAHGNGNINEEAYLKNVRYDSVGET